MADLSIRKQLLTYLLIPLCSLVILGGLFAYGLAFTVANYTYDRWLINSADSVVGRLRWRKTGVVVDMPPAAQAILRYSGKDKIYYQVLRQDGTRISGDVVIPGPVREPYSDVPGFRDAQLKGVPIRIARLRCVNPNNPEDAVLVQVAETLDGRIELTRTLILSIIAPQILLIILGSIAVWVGVGRALQPLRTIKDAVTVRNPQDLSPLVFDAVPVEVKPLVESINDLLDRLRRDLEAQRRFVANAAHQLRTPLAGLRTYTGLTQRVSKDERVHELVGHIDQGIDRMVRMVNSLLCLARIEPGVETKHSRLDLNFIASDSTAELVETALAKNIELTFEPAAKPALVTGNKEALRDLATNLIENAVLYTPPGGSVSVRVSNGNGIFLSVEDDGPGIPEAEKGRVFERFYRILGSDVPGSGLGLAIVREIAYAHNATVDISSGHDAKGTLVSVSFESQPKTDAQAKVEKKS